MKIEILVSLSMVCGKFASSTVSLRSPPIWTAWNSKSEVHTVGENRLSSASKWRLQQVGISSLSPIPPRWRS